MGTKGSTRILSVEKAITLLNLLAEEPHDMSITEISKKVNWPKSTVHGLISTLRDYQFVEQSAGTGHYFLGVRLFELGNVVKRKWDIRKISLPYMKSLSERFKVTTHLATEDKGEVLYIEKLGSSNLLRIASETGAHLPMHCTGVGKILLAYKSTAEVKWIASQKGLPAMNVKTITSLPKLLEELKKISTEGYAIDDGEIMDELRCIAVPIHDHEGIVRYALSISGLNTEIRGDKLIECLNALKEAADSISQTMKQSQVG